MNCARNRVSRSPRWKVAKETAIPDGRYRVVISKSQRFGVVTPELLSVPGFAGIRIHWGNKRSDTEGCLIVGRQRDDANLRVWESRLAYEALMTRLTAATDEISLVIENPPSYYR